MIEVTHFYGVHQGGTKDYHLYYFTMKGDGRGLLVKRWGKLGADGQAKIEMGGTSTLNAALNDRSKSGYDMRNITTGAEASGTYADVASAIAMLPRAHQRAFSNAQLSILDPTTYSSSDKSAFDPLAAARADQAKVVQVSQDEIDKASSHEELKSNPMFGMF